ncbi:MAG: hypothetical protein H3C35_12735 [Bacteroidetes bacterium]|nr:hypothetical protein [Bacteroidota bacterium]
MKKQISLFVFFLLFLPTVLLYSQQKEALTGCYTNLEYLKETGDVVGIEITIVFSTDGTNNQYYALVQEAHGKPNPPFLVKLETSKEGISFTNPAGKIFKGKITKKELTGKYDGTDETLKLKRKKSYWQ